MTSKAEWMANKHSEDIVYCFADGTTQVIRLVDYLRENPRIHSGGFPPHQRGLGRPAPCTL